MGKNKPKNKTAVSQKSAQKKQPKTENAEQNSVSANELEEAIVKALRRYEKERSGQKEIVENHNSNGMKKWFYSIWIILRMPFAKRDSIKGNEAVTLMTTSLLAAVFSTLRMIGLFISFFALGAIGYLAATEKLDLLFAGKTCFLFLVAFISYLFAGLFRRVSVEVENIKDESLLIAFFAAIGTWISIIIAAVALWR